MSIIFYDERKFAIKVATAVQNLTNESKGNLEKILSGSHLHHNGSHAFYTQTNSAQQEGSAQKGRSSQPPALCQPPPQAACTASWQPPPHQQRGSEQGKSSS